MMGRRLLRLAMVAVLAHLYTPAQRQQRERELATDGRPAEDGGPIVGSDHERGVSAEGLQSQGRRQQRRRQLRAVGMGANARLADTKRALGVLPRGGGLAGQH